MRWIQTACLVAFAACGAGISRADTLEPVLRGLSPSNLRIVGGSKADTGDYPWQMLLRIPGRQQGAVAYCGASLISSRWVLTAAHCFQAGYDGARPVEVLEGLSYRGEGGEEAKKVHEVERPVLHPRYDKRNQENDIALLHLDEDAVSEPIAPLAAADAVLERPPGEAIATGWGTVTRIEQRHGGTMVDYKTKQPIARHGLMMPHGLMKVELPLVDVGRCRAQNSDVGIVTDRNLCAGAPRGGKDTCKGDSGGPLVAEAGMGRYVQIGVTSWGQGCGESDHPGVYTRVSAYADWIRSVTGEEKPAPAPQKPAETATALPPQYDNSAGLDVKLVAVKRDEQAPLDTKAIAPGQQVAVVVATKKPGYLVILDETPDGKLTQIYPNGFSSRALPGGRKPTALEPGHAIVVPDPKNPYAGFAYIVDKTVGEGMISVLQSDAPLRSVDLGADGVKTFASRDESRAYLANVSRELARDLLPKAATGAAPTYSAVYLPYTVKAAEAAKR